MSARLDGQEGRMRGSTQTSLDSLNISSVFNSSAVKSPPSTTDIVEQPNDGSPTWTLSDILQSFSRAKEQETEKVIDRGNELVELLRKYPQLKQDLELKNFINKIQFMMYDSVTELRAMGYRILRYSVYNYESLKTLIQSKVLIFIIITMGTSSSHLEKIEALKLVREFLAIPKGADNLSIGVIKSLIAVIEEPEIQSLGISENFKRACMETLCEVALLKPDLIFHSGGFQVILHTVLDDSLDLSTNCLLVIIKVLDSDKSRRYLRNGYDLRSLVAIFSTTNSSDQSKVTSTSSLRKTAFLITIFAKTWSGLIAFSHNNFECFRDLIMSLKKKNVVIREIIMDMLFDILRIKSTSWLHSSSMGDMIRNINALRGNDKYSFEYEPLNPGTFEYSIINNYLGLITSILINCGIMRLLVDVIEDNLNESNTNSAIRLVTHIYHMANHLLPPELYEEKHLIPASTSKYLLSEPIFKIEKYNKSSLMPKDETYAYSKEVKSYIKTMSITSRYNMDDTELKNSINNTKVLAIKEYDEWNWNLIIAILQGPLRNPKKFDEISEKYPKFLRRIMSFYRPFKYRFSVTPQTNKYYKKFINTGCQLLETLLSLNPGTKYLALNKILPQLSEIFAQVDPFSGINAKEPILGKSKLETSSCIGYIKFIGILTSSNKGIKLLEQWQFFTIFQNIIQGSVSSDTNNLLIINLISCIDYTTDSQLRLVLSKASSISNLRIRYYILDNLLPKLLEKKECERYTLKLLVNNIYDINFDVSNKSINLLYKYCLAHDLQAVPYIIKLKPSIEILSKCESGRFLLMHFLKTPKGLKYLDDSGFIESEFERWYNLASFDYVRNIEQKVQMLLFPYFSLVDNSEIEPSQFFSSLLETYEGLNYFHNYRPKCYIHNLLSTTENIAVKLNNMSDNEAAVIENEDDLDYSGTLLILKQNLWIIGNIASSKFGVQLLDSFYEGILNKSIVTVLLNIFYTSASWQVRGLAFYQLGKMATSIEGMETLDEVGFFTVIDNYNNPMQLCYPKNLVTNDIFSIKINNPYRSLKYFSIFGGVDGNFEASSLFGDIDDEEIIGEEKINEKVLNLMKHLSSILSKIVRKAMKHLSTLKKNSPAIFENVNLFLQVIRLVDKGSYKLHVRKFVFELFLDTKVVEKLVKGKKPSLGQ